MTRSPATRHRWALWDLLESLLAYLAKIPLGEILFAPLDVRLSFDTALQPDLIFISAARAQIIQENFIAGAPDLVVEILSPITAAPTIGPQNSLSMLKLEFQKSGLLTHKQKRLKS